MISLLGGVNRFGTVVGPILGGSVGAAFGLEYAFYVQAVIIGIISLLYAVTRKHYLQFFFRAHIGAQRIKIFQKGGFFTVG